MKKLLIILMLAASNLAFSLPTEIVEKEANAHKCNLNIFQQPQSSVGLLNGSIEFKSSVDASKITFMPDGVDLYGKKYTANQIRDCQSKNKCDANLEILRKTFVLSSSYWSIIIEVDDIGVQSSIINNTKYIAQIDGKQLGSSSSDGNCGVFGKKAKDLFLKKYLDNPEIQKIISDLKMCISDKAKKCEYIENNYLGSGNNSFKYREIDSSPLLKAEYKKFSDTENGYTIPYEEFAQVAKITNYDISYAIVSEMLAFNKDKIEVEFQKIAGSEVFIYLKTVPSDKSNFKYKSSIAFRRNLPSNRWSLHSIDVFYFYIDTTGEDDPYK